MERSKESTSETIEFFALHHATETDPSRVPFDGFVVGEVVLKLFVGDALEQPYPNKIEQEDQKGQDDPEEDTAIGRPSPRMQEGAFGKRDLFDGSPCAGDMAKADPDLHGFLERKRQVIFGALDGSSKEVLFLLGRQDQAGRGGGVDVAVWIGDPDAEKRGGFVGWEFVEFEDGVRRRREAESCDLALPEEASVFEGGFGWCDVGELVGGAEVSDDGAPYSHAEADLIGLSGVERLGGAEVKHPPLS